MQFGETKVKKFNRSQKFVGAAHVAQEEGTVDQQKHRFPHAQGPYGVFPQDTWPGKQDYVTTSCCSGRVVLFACTRLAHFFAPPLRLVRPAFSKLSFASGMSCATVAAGALSRASAPAQLRHKGRVRGGQPLG